MAIARVLNHKMENQYTKNLEERLHSRSDELEEMHMEAAIDSQLTLGGNNISGSNSKPVVIDQMTPLEKPIFDDYSNPNSVRNCLSPYVPTTSERIDACFSLVNLTQDDVLMDIGCGDGRVCISATKLTGCKSIGVDVSPLCIKMAQDVANEEGFTAEDCSFYEADATIDTDILLSESCPLSNILKSVTVIYLFTYPTLLMKLVPLLSRLIKQYSVRAVVTLTYHLPSEKAIVNAIDRDNDIQLYTSIKDNENPK